MTGRHFSPLLILAIPLILAGCNAPGDSTTTTDQNTQNPGSGDTTTSTTSTTTTTGATTTTTTTSTTTTTTVLGGTHSVTSPGAPSFYTVDGSSNPPLTLQRLKTYVFNLNVPGHPFYIMSIQGTNPGNAWTEGVTGNGNTSGSLTFTVPPDAPNTLYYDCAIHPGMTGTITITN